MQNFQIPMHAASAYHVYSHANGTERCFKTFEDYQTFAQRMLKYLEPVAHLLAFSLLPNHFHLVLEFRDTAALARRHATLVGKEDAEFYTEMAPNFLLQQCSNMLNSYSKTFNNRYHRRGKLFIESLSRVYIESEEQMRSAVFYVHKNPVHHGHCRTLSEWPWSSYHEFYQILPGMIDRDRVLALYGGLDGFHRYHDREIRLKYEDAR